jgi:enterochelin esterase-like enzyme
MKIIQAGLFLLLGICPWLICSGQSKEDAPTPKVNAGQIVRIANFRSAYVLGRHIDVWLPEGYSQEQDYEVLYMHDGQMLFDSSLAFNKLSWNVSQTLTQLQRDRQIRPCIVVGIWNTTFHRYADYFPEKPFLAMNAAEKQIVLDANKGLEFRKFDQEKPNANDYLKFLVKELKPFIDESFSTKTGREHTFICGSSMGGLISLYAISEYPDVFGGAACLSTHWPGIFRAENNPCPAAFKSYFKNNIPKASRHLLYFDHGDRTLDSLYGAIQPGVDSIYKQAGYTAENFLSLTFPGEEHSENAWSKRLSIPIRFLLGTSQTRKKLQAETGGRK